MYRTAAPSNLGGAPLMTFSPELLPLPSSGSLEPQMSSSSRTTGAHRQRRKLVLMVLFVLCLLLVLVDALTSRRLPELLMRLLSWVELHPYRGVVAVIIVYVLATILFCPGSLLTIGSGYAIGRAFENNKFEGVLVAVIVRLKCIYVYMIV
jgi:hypothetical protein